MVPKTCFEAPLGYVLRTSWERPESPFQERPLDTILGRPRDVRLGRPLEVRLRRPRDGQIRSLGDVHGTSSGRPGNHYLPARPSCHTTSWERPLKVPLKVLTSRIYREPSGDSQGTKTKIDDLMKKMFFRSNSPCITYLFLFFTGRANILKL